MKTKPTTLLASAALAMCLGMQGAIAAEESSQPAPANQTDPDSAPSGNMPPPSSWVRNMPPFSEYGPIGPASDYGKRQGPPGGCWQDPSQGGPGMMGGPGCWQGMPMTRGQMRGYPMMPDSNPANRQWMPGGPGMMGNSGYARDGMEMMRYMRKKKMRRHQAILERLSKIEARLDALEAASKPAAE